MKCHVQNPRIPSVVIQAKGESDLHHRRLSFGSLERRFVDCTQEIMTSAMVSEIAAVSACYNTSSWVVYRMNCAFGWVCVVDWVTSGICFRASLLIDRFSSTGGSFSPLLIEGFCSAGWKMVHIPNCWNTIYKLSELISILRLVYKFSLLIGLSFLKRSYFGVYLRILESLS